MTATQIATANRLDDGSVVFLAKGGDWTTDINESLQVVDPAEASALEARVTGVDQSRRVVGAYLIEVAPSEDGLRPVKFKERIRAYGPTTHPSFARVRAANHFNRNDDVGTVFANGI